MMKNKIYLSLFCCLLVTTAFNQSFNKAKMDSLFTILSEKNKAMGSVSISKKGEMVYNRSIGYASVKGGEKTPATTQTKYRIGSITKTFTAVIIFQLIEEKKLSLEDKLSMYFPTLPNADKISINYLLSHRSGLHSFTDDSLYLTYYTKPKTQKELIDILAVTAPDFEPGKKTQYSNSNFVVLGFIAEKLTKKTYSQLLAERITNKINLDDTYVGDKTNISRNECYSFSFYNGWVAEPETDLSVSVGAGAIVSTTSDLVKFIEAVFTGKLVSDSSLAKMKTIREGLGMGMFRIPFYNRFGYGHNGSIDGFGSTVVYFPKDSVAVAYCTNGQVYPMNDILIGILSVYFNGAYTIPTFNKINITEADLDKYTGIYSSTQIPVKITVSKEGTTLTAQVTGQSKFPLEFDSKDVFKFDRAGVIMEFRPEKKEFTLKQGGASYLFSKD